MEPQFKESNPRWYERLKFHEEPEAIGTTAYYYDPISFLMSKLVYTDGVSWLIEACNCHWIISYIAGSVFPILKKKNLEGMDTRFTVLYFVRQNDTDNGINIFVEDGNYNLLGVLEVEFSDLKENLKLYMSCEQNLNVLYLPSEH